MEDPRSLRRCKSVMRMLICGACAVPFVASAQPLALQSRLQVTFPGRTAGHSQVCAAVPLGADSLWVTVVTPGADPNRPTLQAVAPGTAIEMIGHDPVSTLAFFRVKGHSPRKAEWVERLDMASGQSLTAESPSGPVKLQTHGWVQRMGSKILPFAVLRVACDRNPPPPGSALADGRGRVAALYFQNSGSGNTGYAIPAEAVHRVCRDIRAHGQLVRGWIGLSLRAENDSPEVVRVLPGSPAAQAGIQASDILTRVGDRKISSYPEAANAFFYLIPGQPVKVGVLRRAAPMEFSLTPVAPRDN